jgi:hypothetical protein
MTDWKPGDIANGHVLGPDLVWRPVQATPPPPPSPPSPSPERPTGNAAARRGGGSSAKRWLPPFVVGFLALVVGLGIGAASTPEVESTNGQTVSNLDDRESELREKATELDTREAEVTALEREAKKNTVNGDGNYEVGVDIAAGTWKNADRGDDCYWSVNADSNGSDILENANGGGPQTLTLEDGQFLEVARCGTWRKVG